MYGCSPFDGQLGGCATTLAPLRTLRLDNFGPGDGWERAAEALLAAAPALRSLHLMGCAFEGGPPAWLVQRRGLERLVLTACWLTDLPPGPYLQGKRPEGHAWLPQAPALSLGSAARGRAMPAIHRCWVPATTNGICRLEPRLGCTPRSSPSTLNPCAGLAELPRSARLAAPRRPFPSSRFPPAWVAPARRPDRAQRHLQPHASPAPRADVGHRPQAPGHRRARGRAAAVGGWFGGPGCPAPAGAAEHRGLQAGQQGGAGAAAGAAEPGGDSLSRRQRLATRRGGPGASSHVPYAMRTARPVSSQLLSCQLWYCMPSLLAALRP